MSGSSVDSAVKAVFLVGPYLWTVLAPGADRGIVGELPTRRADSENTM
jgi:hypothetical protein